ncbi:MAG: hypothetical protein IT381_17240 [Deltaproteobacteria bacterium]|nr:hypothetical protein [Deltaproteobacteria bacterium]
MAPRKTSTKKDYAAKRDEKYASYVREVGLLRVAWRAAKPGNRDARSLASYWWLMAVLQRARAGDSDAKLLWLSASGLGRGPKPREMTRTVRRWILEVVDQRVGHSRNQALETLLGDLDVDLDKLNAVIGRYTMTAKARTVSFPITRDLSERDCFIILGVAMSVADVPGFKIGRGDPGEKMRKLVEGHRRRYRHGLSKGR